jgi:DNA-binding transcriptional ArsR family regulator
LIVAVRSRFTRIPKVHDLILAGVPTEVIPTYCALADYSNNKTGLCWPRMETLARRLSRSPRTIQRHLHLLKEKGLVEFVERRRDWHGRFGAYLYRVVHIAAATSRKAAKEVADRKGRRRKKPPTTGHGSPVASNKRLTKRQEDTPLPPKGDVKEGYQWLFDDSTSPDAELEHIREVQKKREEKAKRRRRGYEWFFE